MVLIEILLSKKVLIAAVIILLISVLLSLFPLIGTLGFEYSIIIAFCISFVTIFISAEYINLDLRKKYPKRKRYSDLISTCFFINFFILLIPFIVGLISSFIKSDCFIKEGIAFFLIITTITVFFASSLGLLIGYVFPKRGFFVGSLCIILIIIYSLYLLYTEPPVFSYNHIYGLFPGPIYDRIILIDDRILTFRAATICWGIFFLLSLKLIHDYQFKYIGVGTIVLFVITATILSVYKFYESDLGIKYTRDYIQNSYFKDHYETEHFLIYFPMGTKVSKNIELIALDHEWQYSELTDYLKVKPKKKIVSYIYADEKARKKVIGAGDTTIANPIQSEIHLVYNYYPHPVLKHELTHVLSSEFGTRFLKISPKVGLIEGLAVAADWNNSDGFNPDEWSLAMLKSDNLLDIQQIIGLGFWRAPAQMSYTLMGSFVSYLINTYGIEKFKNVYRNGEFDVYEKDLITLIIEWKDYLNAIEIADYVPLMSKHKFSTPSIFDDRCPRRSSYLADTGISEFDRGNYYGAVNAFNEALKYNPSNSHNLESLAYAYFFNRDFSRLKTILDDRGDLPLITTNIIQNVIGTYHWTKGDIEEGIDIFNDLSSKPLPIDIENELSIKLDSIGSGAAQQEGIKQYYMTRDVLRRVSILENLIHKFPEYAVPYYLLGRLFNNNWEFDIARDYLIRSELLGMPSEKLRLDNSRLLGISLYAGGDYDEAKKVFAKIYGKRNRGRFGSIAAEFIGRSEWTKIYFLNL